MDNVTDIQSLGTLYTLADRKGNIKGQIQVIPQHEILDSSIGPYDSLVHGSYDEYLAESLLDFSGFEDVDPLKVLWYPTYDDEVVLSEILEYAVKHGYNKIILEYLDDQYEND
jgi:hypothetical protein